MHLFTQTTLTLFLTLLSFSASLPALPANVSNSAFSPLLLPTSDNINLTLPSTLNNTSLTNPSNNTLTFPFHIPQTRLWLHFKFDDPRIPLSEFDIGGILALANATLQEDIANYGANAFYDVYFQDHTRQWFKEILYDSENPLAVSIKSERTGQQHFTNGQLAHVIRGLDIYLRQGGRFYRARYQIYHGLLVRTLMGAGIITRLTPIGTSGVQLS